MKHQLLVGVCGKRRHGKDTFADCVVQVAQKRGWRAKKYALATAVKEDLARMLGVRTSDIEREKELYRGGLQWYGTDYKRRVDPMHWLNKLVKQLDACRADVQVVSDLRFVNEAEFVRNRGGVLVRVVRLATPEEQAAGRSACDAHVSETELDGYPVDYTFRALSGDTNTLLLHARMLVCAYAWKVLAAQSCCATQEEGQ